MPTLTYGQLIRGNRNFRNLLAGQFISELGNWFNFIAGLGLVRLISDASPSAAGIFFLCRVLPFAVVSPIAGTFVDRFSRRQVMIWTDLARAFVALTFLLVTSAEDLWIAYIATVLLSTFGSFFDGAKNATTPNLTGRDGLLAGTALMFSTRFLLMAIGSGLGGWAAAIFGYEAAFVINAVSFIASAYTVWLIPEEATRDELTAERMERRAVRPSFITELREGLHYTVVNHFALTILLMNVMWAIGGGAINVVFERVGGVYFAGIEGWNPDMAVGILWWAAGLGLTFGMLIAHRTSAYLDRGLRHSWFIGWSLIVHGILFAFAGLMPTLLLFAFFTFISRALIGVEYAVQETLFQRSLPDHIRGRISTLDRGAELTVFGVSSYLSAELMYFISPMTLTVISGVLSGAAGILWFWRQGVTNEKISDAGS
ncbi:MAG TPA: MFS transporter [Pyrinomonadaceae bacterium]|nr:MFS transporter [Chloracidobacterium sp.]HRJ89792.1 MFS transporter [Pyrinomonadaceae bacterium]HRK49165.1 MFS transporter [Pyrinomonadaceae bacterium]